MKTAESKPLYHIDSLAYHFDQLKVEKLDGTLNIGMTPPSEDTIKEIGQLVMPGPLESKVQNPPQGGPIQQPAPFGGSGLAPQSSGPNSFLLQVLHLFQVELIYYFPTPRSEVKWITI